MNVKVLPLRLATDTKQLLEMRSYMLGDQKGKWVVADGDLYLGLYVHRWKAQEHADSLIESDLARARNMKPISNADREKLSRNPEIGGTVSLDFCKRSNK